MVTESSNYESSSFREFVRIMEPSFLEKMSRSRSDMLDSETEGIRTKAYDASFRVTGRNGKNHFGLGFLQNHEMSLSRLLRDFYPCNANKTLSDDEKVAAILKAHPDMYETVPDENGERMFCRPYFNTNKSSWAYNFANDTITVLRGPQAVVTEDN
jgi:hypothetical protein